MVTPRPRRVGSDSRDAITATTAGRAPARSSGVRVRRDPLPALAYLKHSPLLAVGDQLIALEDDLRRIQPSLALRPVRLEKQVLVVTAASAAAAARVRQFEPSLLAGLRARGWLVNRIRFRPQVATAVMMSGRSSADAASPKAPVGDRAVAAIERLHAEMRADPGNRDDGDSPFCAALADFIARQRSYRK